ncbi:hypothetical protein MUK42_36689 [Musa troglodytarum]|uniref:Uncharacterized protein n=1 Tax=Musa troglodytarum TaxID=320322 RepID=A0A9E7LF01_9LILI|nr:hypothetical protein MUK42_36689 [Musa troglodytarum]
MQAEAVPTAQGSRFSAAAPPSPSPCVQEHPAHHLLGEEVVAGSAAEEGAMQGSCVQHHPAHRLLGDSRPAAIASRGSCRGVTTQPTAGENAQQPPPHAPKQGAMQGIAQPPIWPR